MELNRFFNLENRPIDYLGKYLYTDWDGAEWNMFHNFMLKLSLEYHREKKLLKYSDSNSVREYLMRMNIGLYDFLVSQVEAQEDGETYDVRTTELLEMFKVACRKSYYTSHMLIKDLKVLVDLNLFTIERYRSNNGMAQNYVIRMVRDTEEAMKIRKLLEEK